MIVQFRNEKVSNHGSIPITIDCNVVAFIVFEEGFHQPIQRTKHVVPARISSQSRRHCWRSPLPHASALIQRGFGCVLGVQQTKQLPHVAKVDLMWQLGVPFGLWLRNHGPHVFYQ
ncbi:hypothetical protein TNCV_1183461 [Trichonephila clavipes]|nr:hypothetical protein TNCV_1183461 [Trichonephila clavipes]